MKGARAGPLPRARWRLSSNSGSRELACDADRFADLAAAGKVMQSASPKSLPGPQWLCNPARFGGRLGILEDAATRERIALGPRCLLGRHAGCDVSRVDPRLSGEHAVVRWVEERWEVRDLGSRNGTFLDGMRLAPGERAVLPPGGVISLGGPSNAFVLVDATPPAPGARRKKTGAVRTAADQVLVLPDDEQPLVTVFEDSSGRWVAERDDGTSVVRDRDILLVDGEPWILELPSGIRATWEVSAGLTLETIALRIAVSRDEEHVEVSVVHDGGLIALSPRTHHYLLLTLARAWLHDSPDAGEDRGWVDREELCKMLAVDSLKLNVDVYRIRKQLSEAGVIGAAGVVGRRATTGQLRLGARSVEVATLGAPQRLPQAERRA